MLNTLRCGVSALKTIIWLYSWYYRWLLGHCRFCFMQFAVRRFEFIYPWQINRFVVTRKVYSKLSSTLSLQIWHLSKQFKQHVWNKVNSFINTLLGQYHGGWCSGVKMFVSLWNLAGASAALHCCPGAWQISERLENSNSQSRAFETCCLPRHQ